MLKEIVDQLQNIREHIAKEIGYPCDIRAQLKSEGLELRIWSTLGGVLDRYYYYQQIFTYRELQEGKTEDPLVDRFVREAIDLFLKQLNAG
jgi:hypothetical protein